MPDQYTNVRLVNHKFENLIGNTVEIYVYDMLAKSTYSTNHLENLKKAFKVLMTEYRMKLNLHMCAFGVRSVTFLGYIVVGRGIEPNPMSLSVVTNMVVTVTAVAWSNDDALKRDGRKAVVVGALPQQTGFWRRHHTMAN
ncbi:hypothetical protein ACLB2K_045308 [Fragaria x ananassa]